MTAIATDTATAAQAYECDGCGLCCRTLIIEADANDVLREPRIAAHDDEQRERQGLKKVTLPVLERAWILYDLDKHACPFLTDDNRCGIYATRPGVCVGFQAGSKKCQDLRESAGLPPLEPVPADTLARRINAEAVLNQDEDEGW